jgi:YHS domain-containing protein
MLIRLIVGIIVIYLLYKLFGKEFFSKERRPGARNPKMPYAGEDLIEDPFCHTYVPMSNACRTTIDGKTVYFCSQKCLEQYKNRKKDGEKKFSRETEDSEKDPPL